MLTDYQIEIITKHEIGHYIINRYFNIVPRSISFDFTPDKIHGNCCVEYNVFFDNFNEIVDFSYQRAHILFAGAAASVIDNDTKQVDKSLAVSTFEQNEISDNSKFTEHLLNYLLCNDEIHSDPNPETLSNRTRDCIFDKVCSVIQDHADLLFDILNFILPKLLCKYHIEHSGNFTVTNAELNTIARLTSTFGSRNPSIWGYE